MVTIKTIAQRSARKSFLLKKAGKLFNQKRSIALGELINKYSSLPTRFGVVYDPADDSIHIELEFLNLNATRNILTVEYIDF